MSSGYKCYNCGKGIMVGHNVSHAKNRTRKVFRPNLHSARVVVEGTSMRVKLCTKCLRQFKGKSTRARKAAALVEKNIQSASEEKISTSAPAASGLA
jgi:large subunit ribosomal protein L28